MRRLRLAIDIGGTFTDLVTYDEDTHELTTEKAPSTPPRFIDGVMEVLNKAGVSPEEVATFNHGSTIATNTVIERRGANTGLLTTRGMRDVLSAGRANRPDLFNSNWDPSPPLVSRRNTIEATERMDYEGSVLTPLAEDDVRLAAQRFRARGVESIAVSYLNSFMCSDHELRSKEILEEELGSDVFVCTSAEVLPELREFERTSTVAANAYLAPIVETYLDELVGALKKWGYKGEVFVTHSGGGVMTARSAREVPARICHSGPAGGVIGGLEVGKLAGFSSVITFDMGGTSTDISLVEDGTPTLASEWRVDWNIPILFPAIDLVAIGAGGGTIAWVDDGGSLRCGPESAGADPGPACLGRGNERATITDAHLFLGRLSPDRYLGGDVELDAGLAEAVIERLANELDLSPTETAGGILRIANSNMTSATHLISVERGYDPRDFALVAGGGAGGLHAAEIAEELSIPHVVVPAAAGLTSAVGILGVDLRHDFVKPVLKQLGDLTADEIRELYDALARDAQQVLESEQIPKERRSLEISLDMRYYGQTPYINLPMDSVPHDDAELSALEEVYGSQYEREFGYRLPADVASPEIVNVRVAAIGRAQPMEFQRADRNGGWPESEYRDVWWAQTGDFVATPIYPRHQLPVGALLSGPAVVEQEHTTVLVPPTWQASVESYADLILSRT